MKASDFDYVCPSSVAAAVELLARYGGAAKIISGGQSLVPALNLRLLAPEILIDIGGIDALRSITVDGASIRVGALTRHAELMHSPDIALHVPLLTEAIAHVAHPAIRSRGTIGGNLAHADPASELPACMIALDATIEMCGPAGDRHVAASEFFTGIYETVLGPDEILVGVEVPKPPAGARFYFDEFSRRSGDFAIAGLAAQAVVVGERVKDLRLVYFGIGGKPTLAAQAAARIVDHPVDAAIVQDAQSSLAQDLEPQDDQQASSEMRLHLARVLLRRCIAALMPNPDLERRVSA
jgi:carbon-monoxide dehydrogenase medium subunit